MSSSFSHRLLNAAVLGFGWAQVANLVEGLAQTVFTFPRESGEWLHATLLYGGVGLAAGLLVGLAVSVVERMMPINARGRSDAPLLFFVFAMLVGGYWWNTWPLVPGFNTLAGKLWTAGFGIVVLLLALGVYGLGRWGRFGMDPSPSRAPRRAGLFGVVLVLGALVVLASGRPPRSGPDLSTQPAPRSRPPIVVVLIDTLRRDHLGTYDYARDTSPRLDGFAREAVVFDASNTTGNFTIPSTASFFTGMYPSGHGAVHPHDRFPLDVPTFTERLRAAGYRTAAYVGNPTMRAEMGYARGFDSFHPAPPPRWILHRKTAIERVASRLLAGADTGATPKLVRWATDWITREDARPPFLYLHVIDPHSGYVAPREHFEPFLPEGIEDGPAHPPRLFDYYDDEWIPWEDLEEGPEISRADRLGMIARYDGEIHFVDMWVGRFFDSLREAGIYDEALIVVLSDHGEEFGDHGGWFHGDSVFEEMIAMPLLVKFPGAEYGGTRTALGVDMVDLAPTLEGWIGLPPAEGRQGVDHAESLGQVLRGDSTLVAVQPVMKTFVERPPRYYAIEVDGMKFVRRIVRGTERVALYDLNVDPGETNDLADARPVLRMRMDAMVDSVLAENFRTDVWDRPDATVDPEALRALKALGYVE